MSKKNNKATKARYHKLTLEREREAVAKKQQKADKKRQKEAAKGIPATNKTIKKKSKFGGVRIRKGVTVKGIKIVDSASKKKALARVAADKKEHEMEIDEPTQKSQKVKKAKKAAKTAKASDGPTPME